MKLKKYKISFDLAKTYELIVMATDEDHAEEVLEKFEDDNDISDTQVCNKLIEEGKKNKANVILTNVMDAFDCPRWESFEIREEEEDE
tara:strand:+ start:70 stop:333 length:264 start_codon:yes stop_codon:yes gene_type:complete